MRARTRTHVRGAFKATVTRAAIRAVTTVHEIAQESGVHPTPVRQGKKERPEQAADIFDATRGPNPADPSASPKRLDSEIGRLTMERDWRKETFGLCLPFAERLVCSPEPRTLPRQCAQGVTRSTR